MEHFYKTVDFVPYLVPTAMKNKEVFNMFEGFRFPYTPSVHGAEIKPSVEKWVDHILNIVCCGNVELAKTLTQWFAHIVQVPASKGFAVILYGKQGTGKSILYEFFTRCIGKDLGLQVSKLEDLTQTHNTHVRGKLIINANEATNEPAIRDVNILKGLITETDLVINPKGVNQYTVSNYSRLLITSNYEQCMRLNKDDRRYMCLEISDSRIKNDDYFDPMISDLTNQEHQQDFFNYLANYDISDFKPQRPPMTGMKRTMIGMSVDNIVSFMLDVCENTIYTCEFEEKEEEILPTSKDMFDSYITWCGQNDCKGRKHKKTGFINEINKVFGIIETMPRIDGSRLRRMKINRDELLPKFIEYYCKDDFEYKIAY
jgi:phage/plasmid-associated DNA primase